MPPLKKLLPGQARLSWQRDASANSSHVDLCACKTDLISPVECQLVLNVRHREVGKILVPVVYAELVVIEEENRSFFFAPVDAIARDWSNMLESLTVQTELPVVILNETEKEVWRAIVVNDLKNCLNLYQLATRIAAQSRWSIEQFEEAAEEVRRQWRGEIQKRFPPLAPE